MQSAETIAQILQTLQELETDNSVPKNVKKKITTTIQTLQKDGEMSIKKNKALNELEEIAEDTNMQAYTRTQIFNLVSMLEKI